MADCDWDVDTLRMHLLALRQADELRYQQRYDALQRAIELGLGSQKMAVETAFAAQKEAVNAALSAADRAVSKAESSAEKRFESVNEFRNTLADQQRNLIPRSEVDVLIRAMNEKIGSLEKHIDVIMGERMGLKGGYAAAIGLVALLLTILGIISVAVTLFKLKG